MEYGQKIAELRKSKKMTQADLGVQLNVSPQAVSKWENNLSEPDINSIRKMCEIFSVTVDEFLGLPLQKKEQPLVEKSVSEEPKPVKAILGYCAKCKKAVCAGEFQTANLLYSASALTDKVKPAETPRTFCNACMKEVLQIKKSEEEKREKTKKDIERKAAKKKFFKGIIWGVIVMIVVGFVGFSTYFNEPTSDILMGAIIFTLAGFFITTQFCWDDVDDGRLWDVFLFFCRSFKAPFGLIFELSLDGLIWFLTVKLALWVLCGILSILWFILGLFVTVFASIILFPFALGRMIRSTFYQ